MKRYTLLLLCLVFASTSASRLFPQTPSQVLYESIKTLDLNSVPGLEIYPGLVYVKLHQPLLSHQRHQILLELEESGLEIRQISSFSRSDLLEVLLSTLGQNLAWIRQHPEYKLAHYALISFENRLTPSAASLLLQKTPIVQLAEPVPVAKVLGGTPTAPDDPRISEQKQLEYIRATEAWSVHPGDSSTVIGVIDAGMTNNHEDLSGNIARNHGEAGLDSEGKEKSTNGVDDDGNGYVDDWDGVNLVPTDGRGGGSTLNGEHGTQVCGYAAAHTDNGIGIAGVANQCRFFPMKAAPFNGINIVSGMDGLLYAARSGHKVANLSWGQTVRSAIEQEIIDLVIQDYDLAVVAAGGNLIDQIVHYPAGYRGVLGVGGVDEFSTLTTTWGEHIDVVALAGLTTSGTSDYFDLSSASSYATPIASGVVALARSRWPSVSARGILQHVRYVSVDHEFANLGKEGFVGRGRVDALNAVSIDPMSHPGIVVDSVWVEDPNGARVDGLMTGESGTVHFSVTNLLGRAENASISLHLYTIDSMDVELGASRFNVGQLAPGESYTTDIGVPITVLRPGSRVLPVRFDISADNYEEYEYDRIAVQRTYTVISGHDLSVTVTTSGRIGGDFTSAGIIGEGVLFQGVEQSYEGGVMLAVDEERVLDNLRSTSQTRQNQDLVPIDPVEFPEVVLSAVRDLVDRPDFTGISVGFTGEVFESHPGIFRLGIALRNESSESFDSLRVAYFSDWDIDGLSGSQLVRRVDYPELPRHIFPVTGVVESGLLTTLLVAVEHGRRDPGDPATPLFFALDNGGDPLVIYDEFSDEEKFRILSSGIGNESAGPADVSLAVGTVFRNVAPNEIERFWILYLFSSEGEDGARRMLRAYKEEVYGVGAVNRIQSTLSVTPNPVAQDEVNVSGGLIDRIQLVSLLGEVVLRTDFDSPQNSWILETTGVPSGTYQLIVTQGDRDLVYSLIILD